MSKTDTGLRNKSDWKGSAPRNCDICSIVFGDKPFIDGKTKMGPWGNMCVSCHALNGIGLGTGKGQRYE